MPKHNVMITTVHVDELNVDKYIKIIWHHTFLIGCAYLFMVEQLLSRICVIANRNVTVGHKGTSNLMSVSLLLFEFRFYSYVMADWHLHGHLSHWMRANFCCPWKIDTRLECCALNVLQHAITISKKGFSRSTK